MLSPALAALQPLGAVPHPPRGGCTRHTSLSTPSLAETRRSQWLDLEAVALKSHRHTRRRGCCCASVSGGERFSEPPGASAPGWVQQQQAADGAASGSPAAYAAEGGGDNTFRMDAAMSLEDDMHVFGYEPQPGEKAPFGPPVLLVAGMRAEEVPRVRELLDELGGHTVKLLAVDRDMLAQRLRDVMRLQEPRWDAPRPADAAYGGGAGASRVLLFSGMDSGEKSTVVSAMEARGLPRLCVTSHSADNTDSRLGSVLAEAVQADREYWARLQALREGRPLPPVADDDDEQDGMSAQQSHGGAAAAAGDAIDESEGADADHAPASDGDDSQASTSTAPPGSPPDELALHVQRIHAEVQRRGAAGEDLSFMEDPAGDNEPEWMKELLSHRALDRFVSGPELEELLAQRQDLMDGSALEEQAGGGEAEGYGSLEELMAAIVAKSPETGEKQTPPSVYGPEAPPHMRG